ncbi:MAG: zinc-ribbon domain [Actinomycetota bacterium]
MFCSNCGNQLAGAAFCTNCGTPAGVQAAPAAAPQQTYQQVPPPYSANYAMARPQKSRTTAIVLAVFLNCWTWVYTYRADKNKFWITLAAGFVLNFLNAVFPGFVVVSIGLWIWCIVDVVQKDETWYRSYWERYPN